MGQVVKAIAFCVLAIAIVTLVLANQFLSCRAEKHIRRYAGKSGKKVLSIESLGPFSKSRYGISNVQSAYEFVLVDSCGESETLYAVYGDYYLGSFKDEIRYFRAGKQL